MAIDYLDRIRDVFRPHKTDTPLVVDADAVLSFTIIFQGFEPIGRRYFQVNKCLRLVQHEQLSQSELLNLARQLSGHVPLPDFFSFLGYKSDNHVSV